MAIDWKSPAALTRDAAAFGKFMHVLFGLYAWEWFTSLDFDWELLRGKRRFRWPLIFYLLGRYCLLIALAATVASLNLTKPVDCTSLYLLIQIMGGMSIALASGNLAIRTIALWRGYKFVIFTIIAMMLAHWGLVFRISVLISASWVDDQGCVIVNNMAGLIRVTYGYTMGFDFAILCISAYKLGTAPGKRSELVQLLWYDGLIYFVVAFLANMIALIFAILDLNPVMSVIANVPATTISMIAACRAVRRLSLFVYGDMDNTYKSSMFNTSVQIAAPRPPTTNNLVIQMDVISKSEYDDVSTSPSSNHVVKRREISSA
ncbi:hypothetical protein Moror_4364 [Moniliophthora roreri MCA 2997]|uniref:Transmembrane protein n=1 Tax=Moniliophthora roreri (strain MCA 2997) TaxID=1381753 RepID=V2XJ80_MONRO|nr:hypothetical protein Moror_4364 [Moniliophthora roreri MCA 2997]